MKLNFINKFGKTDIGSNLIRTEPDKYGNYLLEDSNRPSSPLLIEPTARNNNRIKLTDINNL
jgi:hypothetical protein